MTHPLHGRWREHWGDEQQTLLDYCDEYEIRGAPPSISAIGRPAYRFEEVRIGPDCVSAVLINELDPHHPCVIRYELLLTNEHTLSGRATTNRGVDDPIRWTRI